MNYDVNVVDEFKRDTKKLFKKYKSIKSDIGGKSGGYRVIYYTKLASNSIYLLSIYAKTQKENIDIEILKPIINKLNQDEGILNTSLTKKKREALG